MKTDTFITRYGLAPERIDGLRPLPSQCNEMRLHEPVQAH